MTIIEAVVAIVVFGWVILMGAMLIDNEKDRHFDEKMRRKIIKRDFEQQMHNYETYGDIEGRRVIYLEGRRVLYLECRKEDDKEEVGNVKGWY